MALLEWVQLPPPAYYNEKKSTTVEWIVIIISIIVLPLSAVGIQYINDSTSKYINELNQDLLTVLNYNGLISEQYGGSILSLLNNDSETYKDSVIKGDLIVSQANLHKNEIIFPKITNPPTSYYHIANILYIIQFISISILLYLNLKILNQQQKDKSEENNV